MHPTPILSLALHQQSNYQCQKYAEHTVDIWSALVFEGLLRAPPDSARDQGRRALGFGKAKFGDKN